MSSWVRLLAVLALCLRFASAEGDPLPLSLVELVRSSPISSIEDLQRLLVTDSVDEEPDSQGAKHLHSNSTFKRLPRSLGVEPAQQALCKVRTEVLEVTRDMLDRRNANFMLWPPCVEVQRCSGCCNTRARQCVPTVTSTRYLQVMKIQYINKRPHYEKAVISVQDHVECRCESVASPVAPVTRAKKPQHSQQPQRQTPKPPLVKVQSKEELHRHDELKQNQKPQLNGRETVWQPKHAHTQTPATQTPPRQTPQSRSDASTERAQTEQTPLRDPQDSSRQRGGEEKEPLPTQEAHRPRVGDGEERKPHQENGVSSAKTPLAGETHVHDGTRQETRHHNTTAHRAAGEGEPGTGTGTRTHSTREEDYPQHGDMPHRQTEQRHPHNHSRLHNQTEVADRGQHTVQQRKDSERLEAEERHLLLIQQEKLKLQEEKRELLLLQRKLDQEMQQLRQQQQQHHQYSQQRHHHHNHQMQMLTTTHRPVTTAPTTTRPPATPQTQRTPTRPAPSRRRPRKNRKRMSKATMRAILM